MHFYNKVCSFLILVMVRKILFKNICCDLIFFITITLVISCIFGNFIFQLINTHGFLNHCSYCVQIVGHPNHT